MIRHRFEIGRKRILFVSGQALTCGVADGLVNSAVGVVPADIACKSTWKLRLVETDLSVAKDGRLRRTLAFK